MDQYKVVTGVALPVTKVESEGRGRKLKYPWPDFRAPKKGKHSSLFIPLEKGKSVLQQRKTIHGSAWAYSKKNQGGKWKFKVFEDSTGHGMVKGVRIFRIK